MTLPTPTVLVVGAGPAGLAVGYELQRAGLSFRILEKEAVGWSWRNHSDSLRLHTLKGVSALPGLPMPADFPDFPTRAQVVEYLAQYARHFNLPVEEGTEVEGAAYAAGEGWTLHTSRGERRANVLVVATGIWSTPHVPHFAGEHRFRGTIEHARTYKNPRPYVGKRVLVVGVGNTGAELAAELSAHGVETGIVVRGGVTFVPYPSSATVMRVAAWAARTLPHALLDPVYRRIRPDFSELGLPPPLGSPLDAFPVVGFELPEAVAAGRVTVFPAIDHLTERGVCFEDGREAPFDHLLLATGYRPTVAFVADDLTLDERGWPILDGWRAVGHPALFCVGFDYPNTEGWFQAIGRVAREAVAQIVAGQAATAEKGRAGRIQSGEIDHPLKRRIP